jgi:hypothetical protein
VNKKALDQYVSFSEQREELLKRKASQVTQRNHHTPSRLLMYMKVVCTRRRTSQSCMSPFPTPFSNHHHPDPQ